MSKILEIPEKRKLFLESILKLIATKEEKSDFNIKDIDEFTKLIDYFEEFKKYIPKIKEKIIMTILEFFNDTDILTNISDFKFKKSLLEKLEDLSVDFNQIKGNETLKIFSKIEKFENEKIIFNRELIDNYFREINNNLDQILDKISLFEINIDKNPMDYKKEKTILKELFKELKNFRLESDDTVIISFFDYFNDKILKIIKNKKLNFTFIQLKRAFKGNKIGKKKLINYINNILMVELVAAILQYLLEKNYEVSFENLIEIIEIPNEMILKSIILLLDRKKIELIENDNQNVYRLMKEKPICIKILSNIINNIKNAFKLISFENQPNIIKKLDNIKKKFQIIPELNNYSEFVEILNIIKDKSNYINSEIIKIGSKDRKKSLILRVHAAIELYRMRKIPLVFEKGQFLVNDENDLNFNEFNLKDYLDITLSTEFNKALIIVTIKNFGSMTPKEISEVTEINQKNIVELLLTMIKEGQIEVIDEKNEYFLYDIPHNLNSSEQILSNFLEISSALTINLDNFIAINKLDSDNFFIFNDLLIKIQGLTQSLMEKKYNSKNILKEKSFSFFPNFDKFIKLSNYIKSILRTDKLNINIENLIPIKIPKREDDIEMNYDQYIVGFGEINWNINKCLSCGSCVDICPENALILSNNWNLNQIFNIKSEDLDDLPTNKKAIFQLIKKLAIKIPNQSINLPENCLGLGNIEIISIKCIACKKCDDRCPNNAIEFKNIWNFPEVMKEYLNKAIF